MARTSSQIRIAFINSLIQAAANIGIVINPNDWRFIPGSLSETDYKLLLLNMNVDAQSFEEQLNDAFIVDVENLIAVIPPQTGLWFQYQILSIFQFNITTTQVPIIDESNPPSSLVPHFDPVIEAYKVVKYCSVQFLSDGRCQIKVAAQVSNLPVDLDTGAGVGALAAVQSFVNTVAAPGISYVVTSGNSDKVFHQIDVYYQGVYSAVIFANVSLAITNYYNSIPFNGVVKLSGLESAILAVAGVNDVVFNNIQARKDSASFGTGVDLVLDNDELNRIYQTIAGYAQVETTAGKTLSDFRVGSSGILNLNCIPE